MDEWWKEMDTIERKIKIEWRRIEINKREIEELKKKKKKPRPLNRLCAPFFCFQTWCVVNYYLAIDFKTITKLELNQALCQFDATVRNRKGEPCGSAVMLADVHQ